MSDTAAGAIVLAFLQSLKPSVSASAALGEAENLAVTGSIFQRILGTVRRWASGDRINQDELEILDASRDLATVASEGYNAIAQAFTNIGVSNFPRTSRDDIRKRAIPQLVRPETLDELQAARAEKRRRAELEAHSAAQHRAMNPPAMPQAQAQAPAAPHATSQAEVNALPVGSVSSGRTARPT